MATPPRSLTARVLHWLSDAIYAHRAWFLYPQIVLAVLCVFYTVYNLEFLTSRNVLVGAEKEYHRIYLEFKKEFPVQDELVVVVESTDIERNRQFVERLGARLQTETNLFAGVFFKGDLQAMGSKALLFLPEDALADLAKTLHEYLPVLQEFAKANNLVSLFDLVNTQFRTAVRRSDEENQALVNALPALERILKQAVDSLDRVGRPPSPGVTALFEGGLEAERQMYITFGDGRIFLLTAQAAAESLNADAVKRIRTLMDQVQLEVPGVNVGLTGEPVLELDEMAQSEKDSMLATIVSLVLVALIFIFGYNETGRPLKATACLLVGLAYTMAYTTATVGHLNILTITFAPILIGLAIDFGVHLITRYEEELRRGRMEKVALDKAIVNTGMGIFTGAATTAGAFFAMALSGFRGVQEMGIICGGGMLVCLVPMMSMLPTLILRGKQNVLDVKLGDVLETKSGEQIDRRAKIENIWLRRPVTTIVLTLVVSLFAVLPARKVHFDYNLLHMQSPGLEAVAFQDKLIKASDRSVLFAAVVANSLEEGKRLLGAVTNLPAVGSVETMITYLTEDQTRKLELVRQIKETLAGLKFSPMDPRPVDLEGLYQTLFSSHGYLGLGARQAAKEEPEIHKALLRLREAVATLMHRVLGDDQRFVADRLGEFQRALFTDVHQTFGALQNQDASGPLIVDDLPPPIKTRFVGQTGKFLIQVYPKKDVDLWDRKGQAEFIRQLRTISPTVTGTPIQLFEYTELLRRGYETAAWYSLGAIVILVFIHFRSLSCVVLALIPVGLGGLWMLGVMGLAGILFNPANIMTLPLIVGIGVTNGIHILNRFAEEQHPSILARSTGKAVLVSGLTTIAGFGSLILAEHQGIESLGWIMAVGVATCMFVGLTFLPAILNLMNHYGWSIKKPSGTMHDPHWVGRNRGNNLKSDASLVNVTGKSNLILQK
ncbi:MAG TPA: MMPL family transporter [Verrucomicrobiae bacterium]|nr:MMPL family transporter [Verrucomicrobiae bacterium]